MALKRPRWRSPVGFLTSLALIGCGNSSTEAARRVAREPADSSTTIDAAVADGSDSSDAASAAVRFRSCSIAVGTRVEAAECASVDLLQRRDQPDGPTIPVYVARIRAEAAARAQLWLVEGGPGVPATGLEPMALKFHDSLPDVDIYLIDHRGTGLSMRFDCPIALTKNAGLDPLPDCADELRQNWGDTTQAFSTTQAAWDIIELARRTREPGQGVFLLGRSYGAYLSNRALQLAPDLVSAVIVDSGLPASGETSLLEAAARPVEAGRRLLAACASDSECAARLGNDPEAAARSALQRAETCVALTELGWRRELVQALLSAALDDPQLRGLVPAALYRLQRCGADDAIWFDRFASLMLGADAPSGTDPARKSSRGLFAHILLSELIGAAVPPEDLTAQQQAEVFSLGFQLEPYNRVHGLWPRYPADEWTRVAARSEVPLLVMHGGLDSRVPLGRALEANRQAPAAAVQFVEFPWAGHLILDSNGTPGGDCAFEIAIAFLRAPRVKLDAGCAASSPPPAFSAPAAILSRLSASGNVWD